MEEVKSEISCGCPMNAMFKNKKSLLLGVVLGALGVLILVKMMMPSMMLSTHESKFSTIEETCSALKASIEAKGWNCPAIRNINKTIEKGGSLLERQVRLVELCKADYAQNVLNTNPEVSTLMPCAFGVYKQDGKVFITGMNTGLMGKVFGGNIASVMGEHVAEDEKMILQAVIK